MNLGEERGVDNVMRSLEYLDRAVALTRITPRPGRPKPLSTRILSDTLITISEHYERSMEAIKKALSIDPNLSEAYSALCRNKSRYEFDVSGAEAACTRAVQLDPRSSVAHKISASFLVHAAALMKPSPRSGLRSIFSRCRIAISRSTRLRFTSRGDMLRRKSNSNDCSS